MGNLNSYIKNNTETLTSKNYNEIDALIFSELTYIKFEKIIPDSEFTTTEMSMRDYANLLLDNRANLHLTGSGTDVQNKIEMLEMISESERYAKCTVRNLAAENTDSQWAAMTIDIREGDASVIAMRGTDGTTLGWTEDLQLAYDTDGTSAQQLSRDYLENSDASNIYLAGHSKGGNDIIASYVMSSEETRDKVIRLDNFDGPGVNPEFKNNFREGYEELDSKLSNYYPEDSVVGLLLKDNPGSVQFVDADVQGDMADKGILGEHDPFAFQVNENCDFVSAEQSQLSKLLNETVDGALSNLSNEERKKVIDILVKYGVPALIAGSGDDFLNKNKEEVKKIIDAIDVNGVLPDDVREKMDSGITILVNIAQGELMWHTSSISEKMAVKKLLATLVINGVYHAAKAVGEEFGENIREVSDRAQNWISDAYGKVADYFEDIREDIAAGICDFAHQVNDTVDEITDNIKDFFAGLFGKKEDKGSAVESTSVMQGKVDFKANIAELKRIGSDMNRIAARMDAIREQVHSVGRFWFIEASLCANSNNCRNMGNTLASVADQYTSFECKIVSFALIERGT